MIRDVFYYGNKPNAHPREKHAIDLADARSRCTTEHFWIINEYCDYTNFDWDWDFDFLPDEDVWAEEHNNVWPSSYQKDSGTWLCSEQDSQVIIYRADVDPVSLKDIISGNWKIIEAIDMPSFDFKWHPDPTEDPYIYVFGNQWYSGMIMPTVEYHVPGATNRKYLTDKIAQLLPIPELFNTIHETLDFDYSWRPDPTSPPYIYVFGNTQYPSSVMPTIEYTVEGAIERKFIEHITPKLKPQQHKFNILEIIDRNKFDFSWVPDPTSPPYIYVFGNTQYPGTIMPTIEYTVEGATERKYVDNIVAHLLPMQSVFNTIYETLDFDYSWRPDPTSPPYIYVFGNTQYPGNIMPTIEYVVEGATERKYIDDIVPNLAHQPHKFKLLEDIDTTKFDFSWVPDPTSPPYIYVWGNQWNKPEDKISVQYVVEGATEYKYMEQRATRKACTDNWQTPGYVIQNSFDYSWEPNPNDNPYIYQFGTQWQKTGGPKYIVEGATEIKYVDVIKASIVPWQFKNWLIPRNIEQTSFDFSWHPDDTEPNYIYQFASQWSKSGGPRFSMPNATDVKYIDFPIAVAKTDMTHWSIPAGLDTSEFDYSWHPDIEDEPYIYQFGTQWQKTGGPVFTAPLCNETTPVKYVDITKAKMLPDLTNWVTHEDIIDFDYSWHPDSTEQPYIYQWGNKHYSSELKPTVEYIVPGATQIKHMSQDVKLAVSDKWIEHYEIDKNKFDMSWRPDPTSPPYIYKWGNKHVPVELKATLEYVVDNATEVKYMTDLIDVLPEFDRWVEVQPVDRTKFDLTWRPDPREPDYIYVWGNKWIQGELQSTVEYHCPNATEYKYMETLVDVLPQQERWNIVQKPANFDLTWRPDPREPDYIYVWGNKWISGELKPTIEYHCTNASEKKYMGEIAVVPEYTKWKITQEIDRTKFDLSWRPDPREPAYIYTWGNKHINAELKPTLEYYCEDATERKYMGEVAVLPEFDRWVEVQPVDRTKFDLTWRPDPREPAYIYVWGNKWIPGELKSTIEYHCLGATEKKYMGEADVTPISENWKITQAVIDFDFTWRPDPREPDYIYVWGNKWILGELIPTVEYIVPGATEKKYMGEASVAPEWDKYQILIPVDKTSFDFTWRPDPREPAFIYVWGNSSNNSVIEPTIEYHCPGATERKYITDIVAKTLPVIENWKNLIPVDDFDYSWRPDPTSPPYIYVFGNQWHNSIKEPTIEYHVLGATDKKYIDDIHAIVKSTATDPNWKRLIPIETFDYSWRPDPGSPPFIYVFGNKWNDATTEPSIEYHVHGATEYKYINDPVATPQANLAFWSINNNDDLETFDFTWRPNPHSPPQIYQWADNGPRYTMPDATEVVFMERTVETRKTVVNRYKIKTTLEDLILEHTEEVFWAINPDLSYDKFDFSWRPNEENFRHINVFGNEYSMNTQTYYVNGPLYMMGHKEFNYVEGQTVEIDSNLSMFYIDRGNSESNDRFTLLKTRYPQIQKTRYLNTWVDTINRCINKSQTKLCWILNSELDYSEFDFDFYPSPWQEKMVHVFGTQWSHWGTTFMINKETFSEDTKYVKIIEHLNVLNFVKSKRTVAKNCLYDVILIDHGNNRATEINGIPVTIIKYERSYLNTFKKLLSILPQKNEHYVWITSSVCDYSNFDFSYICDPYAKDQLHVFPSDRQKFGDTFLVDVNKLRTLIDSMVVLEDYNKINFNQHLRTKRLDPPSIITNDDTHCTSVDTEFNFPYAIFTTYDNQSIKAVDTEPMNLWSPDTKNIIVTSTGGTRIIVPKEAKEYVKKELYDYPYISKINKQFASKPLDIVFLSNGETGADKNYEHLLSVTKGLPNRVVRVDGINGRVASYHAAANISETPWMFTVFAKLHVNDKFDWSWQPDRLQVAKHYIFNATNPVNGLVYGHQAMIAYNKKITLINSGRGLDFTLDDEHEVVDMNSGIAMYNTDAFSTWRTSFREAIKLRADNSQASKDRLDAWLNIGEGDYAQYSCEGAQHAVEYYESVNGDLDKLRLSYDWPWLKEYFNTKYN